MSWKYHKDSLEGVRKVNWDGLWHIIYKKGDRETWDRVDKKTAMYVVDNMSKWRWGK